MTDYNDIFYPTDLATDVFLWGSFAFLVLCFIAVVWLCRARERRAAAGHAQAALGSVSKTAAS